ncbi:MAG: hypothetical protein J2P54_23935 [Bradyrhizobiaceae bacterium]|nr:hypothetical protein [Bradyrhizobiaceae bacterium]
MADLVTAYGSAERDPIRANGPLSTIPPPFFSFAWIEPSDHGSTKEIDA